MYDIRITSSCSAVNNYTRFSSSLTVLSSVRAIINPHCAPLPPSSPYSSLFSSYYSFFFSLFYLPFSVSSALSSVHPLPRHLSLRLKHTHMHPRTEGNINYNYLHQSLSLLKDSLILSWSLALEAPLIGAAL